MGESHDYRFERVDASPDGIRQCCGLLRSAFPDASEHFTEAYLTWQYAANPCGTVVGFNAFDGDELAAHYATLPLRARYFGEEVDGLLSLNTATHPDHQRRGLFTRLATRTYEDAAERGYRFVTGVANAQSMRGFMKMGFQSVVGLDARIGFGFPRRRSSRPELEYERVWTPASLSWRLANPHRAYSAHTHRGGVLSLAPTHVGLFRGILGRVQDVAPSARPRRTGFFDRWFRPRVWIGVDPQLAWFWSFYVSLPTRFRAAPLHLIHYDLRDTSRTIDPGRVRYQMLDFDPY